jgi:hypothetical protein
MTSGLFINPRLDTTDVRALLGLAIGTAAAAATHAFIVILLSSRGSDNDLPTVLDGPFTFFVTSSLFWAFGLFTVGAAGWAILHRMSARGPLAAALYGTALPGGVAILLSADLAVSAPIAAAGCIAGLVIWAVSYRPVRRQMRETQA